MLEGHAQVTPTRYMAFLIAHLEEPNELLLNTMLGQLRRIYWSFLTDPERAQASGELEPMLWVFIADTDLPPSTRKIYFRTLQDVALDPVSHKQLQAILDMEIGVSGIGLSPRERSNLAALLAIKRPEDAEELLAKHMNWLQNEDERRRFEFLIPALSPDQEARDAFFASLMDVENRAIESWVVDALGYLHHPERIDSSVQYIQSSLDILEEIQVTGDIFFPARWIGGTLQNHRSAEAVATVRGFLAERPDYNYQLKLKILQAADMPYRAEAAQNAAK